MTALEFVVPLRTSPGGNNREHHFVRARRVLRERDAVAWGWLRVAGVRACPPLPADVHLVRLKPRGRPLDSDNLAMSLKAVRDQVAKELRVDDGDVARIRFSYGEEKAPAWGVRISIQERKP